MGQAELPDIVQSLKDRSRDDVGLELADSERPVNWIRDALVMKKSASVSVQQTVPPKYLISRWHASDEMRLGSLHRLTSLISTKLADFQQIMPRS
jgi:hypothetical protein